MEYLTKPVQVDTGKVLINIRLILNDSTKNLSILVTNEEDTKRRQLKAYPYHYSNFSKEELKIKAYIMESLKTDYITHSKEDILQLIDYLKLDMKNKTKASENLPPDNKEFEEIYINCKSTNIEQSSSLKNQMDFGTDNPNTPNKIIREILITKYQEVIDDINKGETKELVIDCKDFDINITMQNGKQYPLIDQLQHSPKQFTDLIKKELLYLIHEKPPSNNPYEIKEDEELYYLRFKNIDETPLKYMLSDKVGRFTQTQGVIQGVYPVRPQITKGVFECRGCMRLHEVDQEPNSNTVLEPTLCSECGGRSFRLLKEESTYTNERLLLLTEPQEDINTEEQPRQLIVNLSGNKDFVTGVNAGNRVNITGILDSIPDSDKKQFVYNANNITKLEDKTITITPEEKEYFLQLSKRDDIIELLVNSFAPELILPIELKEGVLCYLVKSGEDLEGLDMIHILIISDPATAKSKLKLKTHKLIEKGILTSGTGASGVGLTGAIVKDPITNNWVLTAGAVPLSHKGHCIIDEIDKMSKEDTTHLNNFMEEGKDDFNKAGVNGSLFGKTSIMALGNPKFGRYDKYKSLQEQVDIRPSFQSRFDLIFLLEDKPDQDKDPKIIDSILNGYDVEDQEETLPAAKGTGTVQEVSKLSGEMLKKYLAFARNNFNPKLTPEARQCIKEYGLKVRTPQDDSDNTAPYHFRFIRAIPKLAGAFAKLHLRDQITKEDVQKAIDLKNYSMKLIGLDPITNTIDPDRITGNFNKEDKRERDLIIHLIKEYVEDSSNLDSEGIPRKVLLEKYELDTDKSESTFKRRISQLKRAGEIIETGRGRKIQYKLK